MSRPMDSPPPGSKTRRFRPWANVIRLFRRKESTAGSEHIRRGSERKRTSLRKSSMLSNSVSFDCLKKQATEVPISPPEPIPGIEDVTSAPHLPESHDSKDSALLEITEIECHEAPAAANSSSPSLIPVNHLAELRAAIRRRRSSDDCDEEDLGLPHSPASASLATTEILSSSPLNHGNTTRSTGSDASLLSMDTLENDEELPNSILSGPSSCGSSEQEARIQMLKQDVNPPERRSDGEYVLSHSAARHKISVRPKKTHALPRHRQRTLQQQPTTITEELSTTSEPIEDPIKLPTQEILEKVDETQAGGTRQVHVPVRETEKPPVHHQLRSQSLTRSDLSPSQTCNSSASSTKLARSKSSVDKKIQYEVVSFWRRIREKEAVESTRVVKTSSPSTSETRRSRHSKADNKKNNKDNTDAMESSYESTDSHAPQPFLSRIFGSKRNSGRRKQHEKTKVNSKSNSPLKHADNSTPESSKRTQQLNKELETIEVAPETICSARHNAEDVEDKLNLPRFSGPHHQKRITAVKKPTANDTLPCESATDDVPSKTEEVGTKTNVTSSNRAKIHIAGLSPYQRRVARIGNSLDIDTDVEFDESFKKADRKQLIDSLTIHFADRSTDIVTDTRKDVASVKSIHDLDQPGTLATRVVDKTDLAQDGSTSRLSNSEAPETPISSPTLSNQSLFEDVQDKSLEKLSDCEEVFVQVSHQVHEPFPLPTDKLLTDGKPSPHHVPEFLQVQLHKVELRPNTNVVFDTETRPTALAPQKAIRKQRAKSFETGVLQKSTSRITKEKQPDPGLLQPTLSEREQVSADNGHGVFVMNVRNRNHVNSGPFLGRTLSTPAERSDVRPVVVLVKNGVPTTADVDREHQHVKDPFQSKVRQLIAEEQSASTSLSVKAAGVVDVTDTSKENTIQTSQIGAKDLGKASPRALLLSMENHGESVSSCDIKLRHRGMSKEIAKAASVLNELEPPELIKVFARRSQKFSEEVNDVSNDGTSTAAGQTCNREIDATAPDSSLQETPPTEKVAVATEDYENLQNVWKRMVPQKKILNKNHSNATDDKLRESVEVGKTFQTRQSKVLDLVHNFQRLQVS